MRGALSVFGSGLIREALSVCGSGRPVALSIAQRPEEANPLSRTYDFHMVGVESDGNQ
jgi:hypothetical protein